MNNNDRLVRLRYALDIKDSEMTEIFKLGESNLSIGDVRYLLSRESENDMKRTMNLQRITIKKNAVIACLNHS